MAGITATGLGSNLDITSLISQLMSLEKRSVTALDTKEAGIQAKISAYGSVKGVLSSLQTAAESLDSAAIFSGRKASIADASVSTIVSTSTAAAGSYSLEVSTLASAQVLASTAFTDADTVVGTGTLTIELGSYSGGSFTANPDKTSVTITLDSNSNTLADIRDAINASNAGVSASLVDNGSGVHLALASSATGTENALRITSVDDDGNNTDAAGLSRLIYDASSGGTSRLTEKVAATDATLKVNGIDIVSSSNTITGAIDGVTLILNKTNVGEPTKITVSQDYTSARTAIESFVKGFNDATKALRDLSAYNATTDKASTLQGEGTVLALKNMLANAVTAEVTGGISLSSIGISVQKDGSLAINSEKLTAALENGNAKTLFVGTEASTGLSDRFSKLIAGALDSGGVLAGRTQSLNDSVKSLDARREVLNRRLEMVEARYKAQFTALDSLISSMTTTGNFLTQQLANLPGSTSS